VIESDKHEFLAMLKQLGSMPLMKSPGENIPRPMARMYWDALSHRSLAEVQIAINEHLRDKDRGRFFPLPADIEDKLPGEAEAWLSGDEAWALMPKDESSSAAICQEMAEAYGVAQDLVRGGDMVAARRAFIDAYERRVTDAKRQHRRPQWFVSLGDDREGRYEAQCRVVELNNSIAPPEQRKPLPAPPVESDGLLPLLDAAEKTNPSSREHAAEAVKGLMALLAGGGRK